MVVVTKKPLRAAKHDALGKKKKCHIPAKYWVNYGSGRMTYVHPSKYPASRYSKSEHGHRTHS